MNIGLSQRILYHNSRSYDSIEHGWYDYLRNHNLIFIPNGLKQDFDKLADTLDLLILTGGDDSKLRRTTEIKIASKFLHRNKPILGVCHGSLLLTDILGGTIEDVDGHINTSHSVYYLGDEHYVNSYHSLAIKKLHSSGTELVVDPEGNCEAWIDNKIAGVMWHPERMKIAWLPDEIQSFLNLNK